MITLSLEIAPWPTEPAKIYKSDAFARESAKERRDKLREAGLCINGASHGKATHGVRCVRCYKVHRGEIEAIRAPLAHCRRGHAFSEANTLYKSDGTKNCRTCRRLCDAAKRLGVHPAELAAQFPVITDKSQIRGTRRNSLAPSL